MGRSDQDPHGRFRDPFTANGTTQVGVSNLGTPTPIIGFRCPFGFPCKKRGTPKGPAVEFKSPGRELEANSALEANLGHGDTIDAVAQQLEVASTDQAANVDASPMNQPTSL